MGEVSAILRVLFPRGGCNGSIYTSRGRSGVVRTHGFDNIDLVLSHLPRHHWDFR